MRDVEKVDVTYIYRCPEDHLTETDSILIGDDRQCFWLVERPSCGVRRCGLPLELDDVITEIEYR